MVVGVAATKFVDGNAQTGASVAASETKNNGEEEQWVTIDGVSVLVIAYVTVQTGTKVLVDEAGNTVATWFADTGTWIGNTWTDYTTSDLWDDFIWASDGTPGNNQAQNKQVRDIVNKYGLNREQQRKLHDEITGQNYGYREIEEVARQIKNGEL